MILRLLKLPFKLAGFLFTLVFVGGILELIGMMMYLQWRHEAALERFMAGEITPAGTLDFLLASPDRMLVAVALAVLALFMVLTGDSGGSTHDGGVDFGDGGGGGFGGDGGGGGGGGE